MKCLVLAAPESARETIVDHLVTQGQPWFTVTEVEGHGPEMAPQQQASHDGVLGYAGYVRIEVLLEAEQVDSVLRGLSEVVGSQSRNLVRHWVMSVDATGHL